MESKIFLLCENHHFKHTQKNAVWKSVLKQCLKIIFWIGARTLGDLYCKKNIFFKHVEIFEVLITLEQFSSLNSAFLQIRGFLVKYDIVQVRGFLVKNHIIAELSSN